jgi:hypothetical protein
MIDTYNDFVLLQHQHTIADIPISSDDFSKSNFAGRFNMFVVRQTMAKWATENAKQMKEINDIIAGNGGASLREIDWFVTSYAKRHDVVYIGRDGKIFDVHNAYKEKLDVFHKDLFDPFKRVGCIQDGSRETDVSKLKQLIFFKWVLTTGVIDYVKVHKVEIEDDLLNHKKKK